MLDRLEARAIAQARIDQFEPATDCKCVIVDAWTIERPGCFVFCYQSDRFLALGNLLDQLAGNAPILVDRHTGATHDLGTAYPIEHYIEPFEHTP